MATRTRRILFPIAVFAASGIVGPLIRFVIPTSPYLLNNAQRFALFIYDLVILLWPTQPLAVMEDSVGRFAAGVYAIGANVLLFATLGLLIAPLATRCAWLVLPYAVVCALIVWFAFWGAGFSLTFFDVPAVAAALVLYGVPFWIVSSQA